MMIWNSLKIIPAKDRVSTFKRGTLLTEASGNEKVDSFSKSFAAQSTVPAQIKMVGSNYRAGNVVGYVYKII